MNSAEVNFITYEEAAQLLNRPVQSVRTAVAKGILRRTGQAGKQRRYLSREEVEWFVGKEFSSANAEEYRRKTGDADQYLNDWLNQPEAPRSPSNQLRKTVKREVEQELLQTLAPVLYIFKMSMADAEKKKHLQASMLAYVQSKQIDRQGLKDFAHQLTDELLREDIEPLEEEMYQELLSAIRTVLATSTNELRIA